MCRSKIDFAAVSPPHSPEYYANLVRELCRLSEETELTEFKHNKAVKEEIGRYISALANSAALNEKPYGYVVWGIKDSTHEILGTTFRPATATGKGNEPLETWLLRLLEPHVLFHFHSLKLDGKWVVLLEIKHATSIPIAFDGIEYIRVGEVTKPLRKNPEHARKLWRAFDRQQFEETIAIEHVAAQQALQMLNGPAYFKLLGRPLPKGPKGITVALEADHLIRRCPAGGWDITNLGALLLAKDLEDFPSLRRKAMRVIRYRSTRKTDPAEEKIITQGYASGFDELVDHVAASLPYSETIERFVRRDVAAFPMPAVRELIVNALVHQDLTVTGAGPMMEIFPDRIEITNPGAPLIPRDRLIDYTPRSRNEVLARLMRQFGFCEERGCGIDRVMEQIESLQLPAPRFEELDESTRVTIFSYREFQAMSKDERIQACYWHACLRYHTYRSSMTNATLRERFGITVKNAAQVSRLLSVAVQAGLIIVRDPSAGTKSRAYLPCWAGENGGG